MGELARPKIQDESQGTSKNNESAQKYVNNEASESFKRETSAASSSGVGVYNEKSTLRKNFES